MYKVTTNKLTPNDYKELFSFTVKHKYIARKCMSILLKVGFKSVCISYLNGKF